MKLILLACIIFLSNSALAEEIKLPQKPLTDQLTWALKPESPFTKVNRLEAFWYKHLPKEDGGDNPDASNGYEDGTHIMSIKQCSWHLLYSYIETNQNKKALKILKWLAKNDASGLAPKFTTKTTAN